MIRLLLSSIILFTGGYCHTNNGASVTVLYESLCSDSRTFINQQLRPTARHLQGSLSLKLVPFGKARSITRNGKVTFTCQHGPSECLGNLVQDCTLRYMAGRPVTEIVDYVACEMNTQSGASGNLTCVRAANVPLHTVNMCINSPEGVNLQLNSEQITRSVNPSFIPTILINGSYDPSSQQFVRNNLMHALSGGALRNLPISSAYFNHMALNQILNRRLQRY